jgi:hypothetical protein
MALGRPIPGLALTVIGPATLDLGGFTVGCTAAPGLVVRGRAANVSNGTFTFCSPAVTIEGEGRHSLTAVLTSGGGDGFIVTSDKSKLTRVTSWDSDGDWGFRITGDGNRCNGRRGASGGQLGDGNRPGRRSELRRTRQQSEPPHLRSR